MARGLVPRAFPLMDRIASYRLAPHISFGLVGTVPIFLDLRRDRYFRLPPRHAEAFEAVRNGAAADDLQAVRLLVETGLIGPAQRPTPIQPAIVAAPEYSLFDHDQPAARRDPLIAAELWWRIARVRTTLKRQPFERTVERLRAGKRLTKGRSSPIPRARTAMSARPLVPVPRDCLWDSLALSAFLLRRAAPAELVFGVKLDPFAAHCWLQSGATVLTDSVDAVAAFAPVLVV